MFGKIPVRGLTISLVGRNLFLWDKVPHIDPETMSYTGERSTAGIEII